MDLAKLEGLGIKLTKHKIAVLELFNSHKHLDAHKIFEELKHSNNISLATIYRILSSFEAKGIIIKHHFSEELSTYELMTNEHHDHLICIKCNKVIEFLDNDIESLQIQIAKANNFKIINHSLNIYGLCENC